MKILVVATTFPFPADDGTKILVANRLRHHGSENELTFLCVTDEDVGPPQMAEAERYGDVHVVRPATVNHHRGLPFRLARLARSLLGGWPYYLVASPEAVDWIRRHGGDFDVIEAAEGRGLPYLRHAPGALRVVVLHSVSYTTFGRQLEIENGWADRMVTASWRLVYERLEKRLDRYADLIVTLTKQNERELLALNERLPAVNCLTNGVDFEYFELAPPTSRPRGVCFVGRMDYPPNVDAVRYFADEVWPLVRERRPELTFTVVGSFPTREVLRLSELPGIEVTGHVEDIRPYLRRQGIAVVPTRSGGGILNKILEPLAMGVPVVARPNSIEGLHVTSESELLLAYDSDEFAAQVLRLSEDVSLCRNLAARGRQYVEQFHSWEAQVRRYENELHERATRTRASSEVPGWCH